MYMKLSGTKNWNGHKPSTPSVKQYLILDLICDMGHENYVHERLDNNLNSKTAYHFINEFLEELDQRIKGVSVQDEEEDPHSLYVDIYIDNQYIYTIKNIYKEEIYFDDSVDEYDLLDYEILENYQSSSVYDAISVSDLFL